MIAHPVNTVGKTGTEYAPMVKMGVSGLEVYSSSYHTRRGCNLVSLIWQRELEPLETMGSDFHGKT